MLTIGFATEFYTLWDVDTQPTYFTDSYGTTHNTGSKSICTYIQNISRDLDKAQAQYPDAPLDENLRGQSRSFTFTKEVDLTPNILKFGKHIGKSIEDVVKIDFSYILWLIKDCSNRETRNLCKQLPEVVAYFNNIEAERKVIQDSLPLVQSGEIELLFNSNPNKTGGDLGFIQNNAQVVGELPNTLVWEPVNEFQSKTMTDWFTIEKAQSKIVASHVYKICRYKGESNFHLNGENFNTIEEARKSAEIQELVNDHSLQKHMVDTKFSPLVNMHYAVASIGEGNTILVFFNDVKEVGGFYPYNMGIINGKAMKLKGKILKVNIELIHTEMYSESVCQYVILK